MKIAFFSPMPPAKSGIADYSETLLEHLRHHADIDLIAAGPSSFDPSRYQAAIYQIGNNGYHAFVHDAALRYPPLPGIVVMHEANLHHLITELTIRRQDWDGYVREAEYNGGASAREFAERVRRLEVGPDYEGLPMTRRILESAAGVIVHSGFMQEEVRKQGFTGPLARIPHGAWIPRADRHEYRYRLGLDLSTPLVGVFGFLKPYKRIAESLRAFRRLVRVNPSVKMILVGEEHPDFPVRALIERLELTANVRLIGFAPIDDFVGYMAACDVVLNLRYPTVGESSGSLLRALGLGKAVLVSEVGAFAEFSDDICLRVPVDSREEDLIFQYLNLLTSRLDLAHAMGDRARAWVDRECNWDLVARRYVEFVSSVAEGRPYSQPDTTLAVESAPAPESLPVVELPPSPEYITTWTDESARDYVETHLTRLQKTLAITPAGNPDQRILEMGAYLQITPALHYQLGYGYVRGCYYGKLGHIDHRVVTNDSGESFECDIDHFDAEKDPYPYSDGEFDTVLCCELIEHLFEDPMHLMCEVNRILKDGGHFVLTTPNIASLRALSAILQGYHPGFFTTYIRPSPDGEVDARHNREYAPREIYQLLQNSGFDIVLLETGPFRDDPRPEYGWVEHLLNQYNLPSNLRGDGIYAVGRKTGSARDRYPDWLYT